MPDYKALYLKLFRAQNKAIKLLEQAGQESEEMVLDSEDVARVFEFGQLERKNTSKPE